MPVWSLNQSDQFEITCQPDTLYLSADGHYILVKDNQGAIEYYDWKGQVLWTGKKCDSKASTVAVSNDRQSALFAFPNGIGGFQQDQPPWSVHTSWEASVLYCAGDHNSIIRAEKNMVICLDASGSQVWQNGMRKPVKAVVVVEGQCVLAGSEDGDVVCLSAEGEKLWDYKLDKAVVALAAKKDLAVVADAENSLVCLDGEGQELYKSKLPVPVRSLAVTSRVSSIAVGGDHQVTLYTFTSATTGFSPLRRNYEGARQALAGVQPEPVANLFFNPDGEALVVESQTHFLCFDMDGKKVWERPKAPLIPVLVVKAVQTMTTTDQPVETPEERRERERKEQVEKDRIAAQRKQAEILNKINNVRQRFTQYAYALEGRKTKEARLRQNIRLDGQILDVYFDGKGYLFVPEANIDVVQRAARLARHTNIYIISYDVPYTIMDRVKQVKGVHVFDLADGTKTAGFWESLEFEMFAISYLKISFDKI